MVRIFLFAKAMGRKLMVNINKNGNGVLAALLIKRTSCPLFEVHNFSIHYS